MQYGHQGMPGRVLRSGCVQVVQNLRIIPAVLHPRCRLPDALAGEVGEVVYVPVYDTQRPHAGPVAVLEALLSARASDSMMVASFISVAGSVLASLQLSLSNPLPQPVCRSKLEGRKPRPVHDDSAEDLTAPTFQKKQCQKQQQQPAGGGAAVQLPVAGATAFAQHPCSPVSASPEQLQQQQQQACSPSSGSAGTLLAVSSAGMGGAFTSAAAASVDCTLTSTLSSRPSDVSAVVPAELPGSPGSTAMLPPRALAAGRPHQQQQHRRQRQHDDGSDGTDGSACGDASPRPCKLRRSLSIVRTKSVSAGLDQVLALAAAACLPTASC
jgi:hypothetical protein